MDTDSSQCHNSCWYLLLLVFVPLQSTQCARYTYNSCRTAIVGRPSKIPFRMVILPIWLLVLLFLLLLPIFSLLRIPFKYSTQHTVHINAIERNWTQLNAIWSTNISISGCFEQSYTSFTVYSMPNGIESLPQQICCARIQFIFYNLSKSNSYNSI